MSLLLYPSDRCAIFRDYVPVHHSPKSGYCSNISLFLYTSLAFGKISEVAFLKTLIVGISRDIAVGEIKPWFVGFFFCLYTIIQIQGLAFLNVPHSFVLCSYC